MKKIIYYLIIMIVSNTPVFSKNLFTISGYGVHNPDVSNGTALILNDNTIYTILWDINYSNSLVVYSEIGSNVWKNKKISGEAYFIDKDKICSIEFKNKIITVYIYNFKFDLIEKYSFEYILSKNESHIRGIIPFSLENDIILCIPYLFKPKGKFLSALIEGFTDSETVKQSVKLISLKKQPINKNVYFLRGNYSFNYFLSNDVLKDLNFSLVNRNSDKFYFLDNFKNYKYVIANGSIYEIGFIKTRKYSSVTGVFEKEIINPDFNKLFGISKIFNLQTLLSIQEDQKYCYLCIYSSSLDEHEIYIFYKKQNEDFWQKKIIKFSKKMDIDDIKMLSSNDYLYIGLRDFDIKNEGIFRMITLTEQELISNEPSINIEITDNISTDADLVYQKNKIAFENYKEDKEKKGEKTNIKMD